MTDSVFPWETSCHPNPGKSSSPRELSMLRHTDNPALTQVRGWAPLPKRTKTWAVRFGPTKPPWRGTGALIGLCTQSLAEAFPPF